jgi:hypothetical protein
MTSVSHMTPKFLYPLGIDINNAAAIGKLISQPDKATIRIA